MTTGTAIDTYRRFYIDGRWVEDDNRERVDVVNPATEQIIAQVQSATLDDAALAVDGAVKAFRQGPWPTMTYAARAAYLDRFADLIEERDADLAKWYIADQGGLATFAPYVGRSAQGVLRFYAELGRSLSDEPETKMTPTGRVQLNRMPVGPVFASVPWNAPLALAIAKLGPALLAGCPVVLKSSLETPLVPYVLAEIFAKLELPDGVINHLVGGVEVGQYLVAHPDIAHVSFTGSTRAGLEVAKSAAANLTRLTLELGGKGAALILDDIEPSAALPVLFSNTMTQSGQVCTTSSRILVPASRYGEWEKALTEAFASYVIGSPADTTTTIGPLVSERQRSIVEGFIASAREEGATILAGGGRPAGMTAGYYVEPTLVGHVTNSMRIVQEEVFGPVITLQAYGDIDEAVELVNSTRFGLANAILTDDVDRAVALTSRLRSGTVNINTFGVCKTEPSGGFGLSGIGCEGGVEAVEGFTERQQVQFPRP